MAIPRSALLQGRAPSLSPSFILHSSCFLRRHAAKHHARKQHMSLARVFVPESSDQNQDDKEPGPEANLDSVGSVGSLPLTTVS